MARDAIRSRPALPALLLLALAAATPLGAAERTLRLDPAATTIRFRVQARAHQVVGTIPLVSGELRFDPATGAASGEIVMDPARAVTGIGKRDRTMRAMVFEVARFPLVVFEPTAVVGELPEQGEGEVRLEGILAIHGGEHRLSLPVTVQAGASGIRATTTFEVPYVAWGMTNPGNAMLRVADTVEVRIEMRGTLQ